MKAFNAIQIVLLLLASPTLLSLCWKATFVGSLALFWIGAVGALILTIWVIALVHEGL